MLGVIIVHYTEFFNSDIFELAEKLEWVKKQFKEITGYQFDNDHKRISDNCGNEFSFSVTPCNKEKKSMSFNLWDSSGSKHVYQKTIQLTDENKINVDDKKEILERLSEYSFGKIHCSDCDKLIKREDAGGHYFAGTYCIDCWNRKWKAIEAKETYD